MAVTLEWVRDNYDTDKTRRISEDERNSAFDDWTAGNITQPDFMVVLNAYDNQTLLPAYGTFTTYSVENVVSLNIPTWATLKVDGVEVI